MKLSTVIALTAVTTTVAASPHRHVHRRWARGEMKRQNTDTEIYVPVATVIVYVLNGQLISEDEVRQGIVNGTLVWGDDSNLSTSSTVVPSPTSVAAGEQSKAPESPLTVTHKDISETSSAASVISSVVAQPDPPRTSPESKSGLPVQPEPQSSSAPVPTTPASTVEGIDIEFPNEKYSCNEFPLGYGATPVKHAGLGGWIGIQDPQIFGASGFDDITTVPHGSCSDGKCCKPGAFCSYSCPPGYLKSSWPEKQGKKGQSIGGLHCNDNNKLKMASGSIAKTLCVKGTDKITIKVVNKLQRSQSICRTDYPGTESETVPVTTRPGESSELACPDNSKYYHWQGKPTSAQYYINNGGVEESEACQWGDGAKAVGNWAPVNLGVGFNDVDQKGYISLFQNSPTTNAELDFNVELIADDMNGKCKYSNGRFHYGEKYGETASGDNRGCTIALNSGTLAVVLTER
ncbi:hypothetical protein B0J11DRAFT_548491 [Dendryphion nanum]|uniref:SUN-domain-containing protein n=1 Tax=Dendryphion nanum TaxID=256645 RepID=A0A9P9E8A7_9PLEO|nr:hypothetical protein B0J11DRAFT_548491 [Dendryphion nanum]